MKREIEQITITLEVELYDKLKKNANKNIFEISTLLLSILSVKIFNFGRSISLISFSKV